MGGHGNLLGEPSRGREANARARLYIYGCTPGGGPRGGGQAAGRPSCIAPRGAAGKARARRRPDRGGVAPRQVGGPAATVRLADRRFHAFVNRTFPAHACFAHAVAHPARRRHVSHAVWHTARHFARRFRPARRAPCR
ncbi:hypothetical protein DA2_2484 [Desulfovibrio sp. A2]|nr:hypothetical protein DA2_2484 [Desulfovibrio sp. A2]